MNPPVMKRLTLFYPFLDPVGGRSEQCLPQFPTINVRNKHIIITALLYTLFLIRNQGLDPRKRG
jgi:hypothetical protein